MRQLNWIATQEKNWVTKWDNIQMESSKGMFTQSSSWLMSYRSYGFDYVLFLGVDGEKIYAGFGCLIIKIGFFKMVNCNWGPYREDEIDALECVHQFHRWAKANGTIAIQINIPTHDKALETRLRQSEDAYSLGNLMKKVFSPAHFNWIDLPDYSDPDADKTLMKSFSENARRNIKTGLKNNLQIERVISPDQLREVYTCFENNASREGYLIRDWHDIHESLKQSLILGHSIFFTIRFEEKLVGAIWAAKGGRAYHYIMGGVERTEKDLKVGHLLQWSVMQAAMKEGFERYNISVGGSDGVVRFKSSFSPTESQSGGIYHLILRPFLFIIFQAGFRIAGRNKKLAAKVLKLIR